MNRDKLQTATIVNASTAVAVGGSTRKNDTNLWAVNVVKALTGTAVIAGFADQNGAAQNVTIPAGGVGLYDFGGAINNAGQLTITCANAADALNVIARSSPA